MVVFVKCRRSARKCFFRSYVFADCGHEDKEKHLTAILYVFANCNDCVC